MIKACVIGKPVAHSLSPRLHSFWLKQHGIIGEYTAREIAPEALGETIRNLHKDGFAGCNITVPHKEMVMEFLDEIDPIARAIGAVNMIAVMKDGRLKGTNTDAYGFMENIKSQASFAKNKAVLLGAGGAARAVIKALLDEGFAQIILSNRTKEKAENLKNIFGGKILVCEWADKDEALSGADLLVNTTSLGLKGKVPLEIDFSKLPKNAVVNDIVYNPLLTDLLRAAKANGNQIIDGLGMLIYQAVPAFEAFFGVRPEISQELRKHLLEAL